MKIVYGLLIFLLSHCVSYPETQTPCEYVVLVNELPVYKDSKIVAKYKYLNVIKVSQISKDGNKYLGTTECGEIDMDKTNYITDENKYVTKVAEGTYVRYSLKVPKVKYSLVNEDEAKYISDNISVYMGLGYEKDFIDWFDDNKFIMVNNQKIYIATEKESYSLMPANNKTISTGVMILNDTRWALISVHYAPEWKRVAQKVAFSILIEYIKKYPAEK